ncbi:MAG: bifunctional adenosylcobinamide kinase/adenosylcobinamide-phosphate guanylyltransferase [Eubacterium sp.]|nr:bifunctional adenosylcobinamide kinase/adenosylcobinamide-phosphate guanylyltransferase [Eubacterium sp.]
MIFVTGPLYAGKKTYIKKALGVTDEELASRAIWDVQELAVTASPEELADRLSSHEIIIATEVGAGVVPLDPDERAYREAAGRLACCLAERADCVIRVCCGLPQILKGSIRP